MGDVVEACGADGGGCCEPGTVSSTCMVRDYLCRDPILLTKSIAMRFSAFAVCAFRNLSHTISLLYDTGSDVATEARRGVNLPLWTTYCINQGESGVLNRVLG